MIPDVQYNSSEEFQRVSKSAFIDGDAKKAASENKTQNDKFKDILDKYIAKHDSTKSVRELAKENKKVEKYGADYQLDLSADIVEILEKIKNEVR